MPLRDRFLKKFPNPLEVDSTFAALVGEHAHLCRLEQLPHLSHGYHGHRVEAHGRHPMHVLRITSPEGPAVKPAVLLMRSHHTREWINAIAVVETARQLLENYRPDDPDPRVRRVVSILDSTEVMIIPEGNPDGARLSFFDPGQRLWRKNLRPPGESSCHGVDCNRYYPRYWGDSGSSGQPCAETYRGPSALSEPDSMSIAQFTDQHRHIIFAIDSHSHGQAIFRPTKSGGRYIRTLPVPDEDELVYKNLETAMNRRIRRIQGIQYRTGTTSNHAGTSDEVYSSSGTSLDSLLNVAAGFNRRLTRRTLPHWKSPKQSRHWHGVLPGELVSISRPCFIVGGRRHLTKRPRINSQLPRLGLGSCLLRRQSNGGALWSNALPSGPPKSLEKVLPCRNRGAISSDRLTMACRLLRAP